MNRPAIILALVATFLIGVSLGLVSGFFLSWRFHRPPAGYFVRRGPGMGEPGVFGRIGGRVEGEVGRRVLRHTMVMPRLREALDLTDAQAAKIEPLVEEAHRSMGATRDSLRARIERVLTPEQRERWRRLEAERRFPGEPRGPWGRANRALPGTEGERP